MGNITKSCNLSEKDIETMILDFLNKRGIFAWKNHTVGIWDAEKNIFRQLGKFSIKGSSDILGVLNGGRLLAIEVKSERGRVTKEQLAFIKKINSLGGLAFIARSIEDVIINLNKTAIR